MNDFTVLTYERVSTDDQALTKSCDDQKTVNDRFITSNGWIVAENGDYRDEGISGSTTDRPGLQDLLIRCEKDPSIQAIIVTETDRLARGNRAFIPIREALKLAKIKVVAVTQPMINDSEEGEMFGEIMGAINGFFSQITRRKSMRALDEKAERGWYPSKAPLGYKNVNIGTDEKPDRIIEVDEDKAPYVRQIPKLYNHGLSYQEISDRLSEQGLIGSAKGKASGEEIRKILFNDFYIGEFSWRGKKYKANHPPLFSYFEVQKARNRSHEKGHISSINPAFKDKFAFKKLTFYCATCKDLRITAECKVKHYPKTNRTAEYIFYHCTKSKGGWKQCTQPSINRGDLVNEFALKAVSPVEIDEDLAEFILEELDKGYTQKKEERHKLLDSINRRLGQIDTELKNLFEMRVSGQIYATEDKTPDEIYEEYRQKKDFERKNLLKSKVQLENDGLGLKKKASNFFSDCCNATTKFLAAKEDKQFKFLRRITSNVLLDNKKLVVTHQFPFNYLLNLNRIHVGSPAWTRTTNLILNRNLLYH